MDDQNINQKNIDQNTNPNSEPNTDKLQEISQIYNPQTTNGGGNVVLVNRSPIDYYILAFQKYGQFSGRATRSEYWWFYLVTIAVSLLLAIIDSVFSIPFTLLFIIYSFGSFIPTLALLVRRLHDTGKNGWFLLVIFIPFLGILLLAISMFTDSTPGDNKYGPNPKGIES